MSNICMCKECLTVFNKDKLNEETCPMVGCYGDLFEIDEEMIPFVIELRSKGYETLFCCQGHITDYKDIVQIYIMLDGDMSDNNLSDIEEPDGFKVYNSYSINPHQNIESGGSNKREVTMIEKRIIHCTSYSDALYKLATSRVELLRWIENLPNLRDYY